MNEVKKPSQDFLCVWSWRLGVSNFVDIHPQFCFSSFCGVIQAKYWKMS
jgi:hypothetical protein